MAPASGGAPLWTNLIPILIVGMVILRNARARKLRVERLWIAPAMLSVLAVVAIYAQPPRTITAIAIEFGAVVIGGLLGWWRGRASRFTVDPQTHLVTSRVSPLGMLLILGIVALRYVLRAFVSDEATVLHVTPTDLADAFLLLAVGLVFAQRIEWFIRAHRMIAEAKATAAPAT